MIDWRASAMVCLALWISCAGPLEQPAKASAARQRDRFDSISTTTRPVMLILVGAAGLPEYGETFSASADAMLDVAEQAGFESICIGRDEEPLFSDDERRQRYLAAEDGPPIPAEDINRFRRVTTMLEADSQAPLWIVMFGHGTFDGRVARFNLRGPDISAKEMAEAIESIQRPTVIVNCSASSAPFMNSLSRPGRVVITSTRDGAEQNFSRFGSFFASALSSSDADLDKDNQVSLLEAFLFASYRVTEFYESEKRLATEHALIDDNGDQRGTPYDWFVGVRVESVAQAGMEPDGRRAHQIHLFPSEQETAMTAEQRHERQTLELQLDELRRRRGELGEAAYLEQLDAIASQLIAVYNISENDSETPRDTVIDVAIPEANVLPPRPWSDMADRDEAS